jgi:hypothetical protein
MLHSRAGYRSARPILFITHIRLATHGRSIQKCHVWTAPAVQGESDSQRGVRVQPCIRPLNAAVLAAGPDVIR